MKAGFQTIVFGPQIQDLPRALDIIAAAGFRGIEIAQRPAVLPRLDSLLRLLEERSLTLVGLAGGGLRERMEYCGSFRPEYLYLERWEPETVAEAFSRGFTLALHPLCYSPLSRLSDALALLRENPGLRFLPDTAHLTIARDSPVQAIRQARDRLAAVHLKDWTPAFGRSFHRYAKGFVEPGAGTVDLDAVMAELRRSSFTGWIIAEQDFARTDPAASAHACAQWLAEKGVIVKPAARPPSPPCPEPLAAPAARRACPPEAEARFLETIMRAASDDLEACYDLIACAFADLVPCERVAVWTCSPSRERINLAAMRPISPGGLRGDGKLARGGLTGSAIERKSVVRFDLTDPAVAKRLGQDAPSSESPLAQMVSVPVLNPHNPNHVRLVVDLFLSEGQSCLSDDELLRLGRYVALAADGALEEACSSAASLANFQAGRSRQVPDFLNAVLRLIQQQINCEAVAILLVSDTGDRLEPYATTGTEWSVPEGERYYKRGEGLTGRAWARKETLFTPDVEAEPGHSGKSFETTASTQHRIGLFAPLMSASDDVVGVVRCANKRSSAGDRAIREFSQDDAAVLEAIASAVVPHLQVLLSQERRAKALGKLTHELRVPLVAIRGASEFMMRTKGVQEFFDYDYPGDIWAWSELMSRLLDSADLFRFSPEQIRIRPTETWLMSEVIAPAVNEVRLLLRERRFRANRIRYGRFEQIPRLNIDRGLFHQVMFNLLSNAIKHAYSDPDAFEVQIDGERLGGGFVIRVRDWGPGIEEGMEEAIFQEGVRGPRAKERDVVGQGLGLWVVRRGIEAHGGTVRVTNRYQPTEFSIYLPGSLEARPGR